MSATIKCTAKRMAGGSGHEHISLLWWIRHDNGVDVGSESYSTRDQMVEYIEKNGNNSVWCPDRNPNLQGAWVHVHSDGRIKYVQTVADGRKSDNLLALPDR
jgi:Protein of unknown function (DUF3892)